VEGLGHVSDVVTCNCRRGGLQQVQLAVVVLKKIKYRQATVVYMVTCLAAVSGVAEVFWSIFTAGLLWSLRYTFLDTGCTVHPHCRVLVNSAFYPSGLGKSSTCLPGWG